MSRKTTAIAAFATVALATTMFPGGSYAVAMAQAAGEQFAAPAPDPTPELVPVTPEFVSDPVVQSPPAPNTPAQTPASPRSAAGSLHELVGTIDVATPMSADLHCLAGAVYFEARGEALDGQLAVAQVIVNRTEDGRFPRSYCGVVAQPGQFSFMRGRDIPRVPTTSAAWKRAVAIARIADKGLWDSAAGEAVFFHARYVRPGWSTRKTRLAQIDSHIFYR